MLGSGKLFRPAGGLDDGPGGGPDGGPGGGPDGGPGGGLGVRLGWGMAGILLVGICKGCMIFLG